MIVTKSKPEPDSSPLDALASQAEQLDAAASAEAAPPGQSEIEQQALSNAQVFAGAIAAGREVFCLVTKLQSPKAVLTDERTTQIGALWGPVLDKHGIQLGDYLGDYALEIAAVIGTVTIAAELRTAVAAEIAASKPTETVDLPTAQDPAAAE